MSPSSQRTAESPADLLELPEKLEPDNPLWRFALAFWQMPGAEESCLALQRQGWEVTRLLCACWLAVNGRAYTGHEDATLTEWRTRVTGALRAIRQALPKAHECCHPLRSGIASLELAAERIELSLAWQRLKDDHQETVNMQGRNTLIQDNLKAAAPVSGKSPSTWHPLNTLAGLLADFPEGDFRP